MNTDVEYYQFDDLFVKRKYPAGETHIMRGPGAKLEDGTIIEAHIRNFEGLFQIVVADDILRRDGQQVVWFLPYFPFAREDRRQSSNDGRELCLEIRVLDDHGLDVIIADPHSDVSGQLRHIPQSQCVKTFFEHTSLFDGKPWIVIPDQGAVKKAMTWIHADFLDISGIVYASKTRNPETGKLTNFKLQYADDVYPSRSQAFAKGNEPIVMIDDICDGGYTFTQLGKLCKEIGGPHRQVRLGVTHGLFTKGLDVFSGTIDKIFTFGGWTTGIVNVPWQKLAMKGGLV